MAENMKLEKMSVFVADYFPVKPGRVSVGQLKRQGEPGRPGTWTRVPGWGEWRVPPRSDPALIIFPAPTFVRVQTNIL